MGFVSAFAGTGRPVGDGIVASFYKDFSSAREVSWQQQNGYKVASFNLNGKSMMAYYDNRFGLVAVIHHLLTDNLPIYLQMDLKKSYSDYWVSDLYEEANARESHYRVTLENANQIVVMNSFNGRDWKVQSLIPKI